jgi:ribosomal protein S27AE
MDGPSAEWRGLRGLRVGYWISLLAFAGLVLALSESRAYIAWLDAVFTRYDIPLDFMPAFVFPFLLPTALIALRLRRFRCPACGRRFMGNYSSGVLFRKRCGHCGTTPPWISSMGQP